MSEVARSDAERQTEARLVARYEAALREIASRHGVECTYAHGVECRGNNKLREKARAALEGGRRD